MSIQIENLPDDPLLLKALVLEQARMLKQLEELVRFFKARQFAPKREAAFIHPGQGTLFNEAESEVNAEAKKPNLAKKISSYERKLPKRRPLPEGLPREDRIYQLSDSERQCPCGACLAEFGEETSEQLDLIPARFIVLRHIRKKYACKSCQETVRLAPLPPQPIPKSYASPGLLAYIATNKYADGLPLYRLENIFSRFGCDIPRATQASWMVKTGELLTPLINLLRDDLLAAPVLHMDETTLQVLKEKDRSATAKSYMWVMARGDPGRKVVLFNYDPSRSGEVVKGLLEGYSGYLVTDGYEGYNSKSLPGKTIHCGCWDHARRKFHDVIKSRPKDAKPGFADEILEWINRLYAVERRAKGEKHQRRLVLRELYSKGIVEHLNRRVWEISDLVTPKSILGKALQYFKNQWTKLTRFLSDGAIPISNAIAENAIRPFAVQWHSVRHTIF